MPKTYYKTMRILFAALMLSFSIGMMAETKITVGAGANFSTIQAAYSSLSSLTAPVVIELQSSYDPNSETYPITLGSLLFASATNTVTIKPAAGVTTLIENFAANPTMILDGAQYVVIDGGNKANLTISNANNAASTIVLKNGASNNTIKNCTVRGASSLVANANILIGASTQTIPCNNNTVTLCDICDGATSATSKPAQGIALAGASAAQNTGNKFTYNNVYNFQASSTNTSFGCIRILDANSNTTTIDNNKVFWQNDVDYGAAYIFTYGIIARGGSNTVTNNTVGFKSAASNPTDTIKFSSSMHSRLYGLKVEGGTTYATRSIVANNRVSNMILEVSNGNAAVPDAALTGISSYPSANIWIEFNNNTIENLKLYNSNNINTVSIVGIYAQCPNSIITNNTIRNITSLTGTSLLPASFVSYVYGINAYETASSTSTISGNKVYNIYSGDPTNTSAVTAVGIRCASASVDKVEKNLIYNIKAQNFTNTAITYGLLMAPTSAATSTNPTYIKNNVIRLGADIPTGSSIYGIYQKESAVGTGYKLGVYNNTICINGTVPATDVTAITSAFTRAISSVDKPAELKNNILVNTRVGGTTGNHYAVTLSDAGDYTSGYLASNNNLFQIATGTNNLFANVATTDATDFTIWKTATGLDAASYNNDPQFKDATATTPDLSIKTNVSSDADDHGVTLAAVTDDFTGATRTGAYDIGAYAFNKLTAVSNPSVENIGVYTNQGSIIINDATGKTVTIYRANGVQIQKLSNQTQKIAIPVENGLYIVKVDSKAVKVIVK